MIPTVIAAELWGHLWARKRVLFRSDNLSVVSTLQSGLCRARDLAFCFRELSTRAVLNNFSFTAKHVPGWRNSASDALSRFRFQITCPRCQYSFHSSTSSSTIQATLPSLDSEWRRLMLLAWAPSTVRSYSSAQRQFITFWHQ